VFLSVQWPAICHEGIMAALSFIQGVYGKEQNMTISDYNNERVENY